MNNNDLAKKLYVYADEYLNPFCKAHLLIENYTDEESKEYYKSFLLEKSYKGNPVSTFFDRLDDLSYEEVSDEMASAKTALNVFYMNKIEEFLDNVPFWNNMDNAYNKRADLELIKQYKQHPPDDLNYSEVLSKLRKVEEEYVKSACKKNK